MPMGSSLSSFRFNNRNGCVSGMEFQDLMFFVSDGTRCAKEEDDPADSILVFYPPEMSTEAQCSWTSQVLGLSRFCRASIKSSCRFLKISAHTLILQEIRSRFLTVLGWRTPDYYASDLVKQDMKDKLEFVIAILDFFVGTYEDLARTPHENLNDLMRTVFSAYPMIWGDLRIKNSYLRLFKDVEFIDTISTSVLHKCRILFGKNSHAPPEILCGLLSFRMDVLYEEIPKNLQSYRRMFLIASLLSHSLTALPDSDVPDSLFRHAFHRVFLPVDDYEAFRLARNLKAAADAIQSASSCGVAGSTRKASNRSHRAISASGAAVPVLLYVLQSRGTYLTLLFDQDQADESFVHFAEQLSVSIPPLLDVVEESAINHILRTQSSNSSSAFSTDQFIYDKAAGMFCHVPDFEDVSLLLLESQLSLDVNSLVSLRVRKGKLACDAVDTDTFQTFTIAYKGVREDNQLRGSL